MRSTMNATLNPPPLGGIYLAEARAQLLSTMRTPAFALPTLLFPCIFYIFFGLLFGRSGPGLHIPSYLLATYGTFGIMAPALFGFGVSVAIERSQGWLSLKQASPMPPSAYFISKGIMAMAFAAAVVLALFSLGAAFGGVSLAASQWLTLFVVLVLGTLPFCALGLWIGCSVSGQVAVPIVNLIYLPMSILSGLWVPIQAFPSLMQSIAQLFPSYHLAQLGLGVLGMATDQRWGLHIGVLLSCTVLFLMLAARSFYRHQD